jgi:hypothetical protein
MGGLLRDFLLKEIRGLDVQPGDVDVVIDGASSIEAVRARLGACYLSSNSFGGAKCRMSAGGPIFDVWRIDDHTNMAMVPRPHTIEQLLRHNLLDIDAVLWDRGADRLYDCGCSAAIRAGMIDFMRPEGVSDEFLPAQVAHVLIVAFKTRFGVSSDVRKFIDDAFCSSQREQVLRAFRHKLPQASDQIESFWEDLLHGGTRVCPEIPSPVTKRSFF